MAIRTTIQIGDPRLKAKNVEVKDFSNPKVKKVIESAKQAA